MSPINSSVRKFLEWFALLTDSENPWCKDYNLSQVDWPILFGFIFYGENKRNKSIL